jgi:hypothetical protein
MTPREKAEEGVKLLKQAVQEYLETRRDGATSSEICEELGLLDSNAKGQRKGHLLWGVKNLLIQEDKLETKKIDGHKRNFLKR